MVRRLDELLDLLAPEVVLLGDGGGVKQAVPRPIVGASKVARLLVGGWRKVDDWATELALVNGYPALVIKQGGELDTVVAVRVDDGRITGLYAVRNPEKLSHMERETVLRR